MPNQNRDPKTGRFISAKDVQETNKALTDTEKLLKDIGKEGVYSAEAFFDIANKIAEILKDEKDLAGIRKDSASTIRNMTKVSNELAKANIAMLSSKKETNKLLAKELIVKKSITSLDNKIAVLTERIQTASEDEAKAITRTVEQLTAAKGYSEGILQNFEKLKEKNDELNKKTSWIDGMAGLADDIPVVGKLFGDFKKGADAARKAGATGGSVLKEGAKSMTTAVGKLALAFSIGTFIKGIYKTDQDITNLERNLNMSEGAARALDKSLREAGISIRGLSGDDLRAATMAVSDELGITAGLSLESSKTIATMTAKFGLASQEAAKLATITAGTGQDITEFNNDLIGRVMIQNSLNKTSIRYQDVMKDVAGASSSIQLSTANMPGGLANAAFQARRLGLSFANMEGIASNLLDYESSIGAEMEAELLTGRNLELDGARRAALNNDMVGMAQELAKNGIDAAEFGNMNRIQQEAIAKAMGMSRDEMSDMLVRQKAMTELSSVEGNTLDDKVRSEFKRISAMEDGEAKEKAMAKLRQQAGDQETIRQLENISAAEAQKEAMDDMVAAVGDLALALKPVTAFFQKISTIAGEAFGFITKMGLKTRTLFKSVKPVFTLFKGISDKVKAIPKGIGKMFGLFKGGMKTAGKGGIKAVLKKIPILGALVGAGLAYQRFKKGDILGGAAEVLSGIASIFPGIGTGISLAIDGALLAGDMSGVTGGNRKKDAKNDKKTASGDTVVQTEDFVIKPLEADTITMAGGTKLGGNVEALLERLIKTVENSSSQDVLLDGYKMGEVLKLGARTT